MCLHSNGEGKRILYARYYLLAPLQLRFLPQTEFKSLPRGKSTTCLTKSETRLEAKTWWLDNNKTPCPENELGEVNGTCMHPHRIYMTNS